VRRGAHLLFQVVAQRYEKGLMILTSNLTFATGSTPSPAKAAESQLPCLRYRHLPRNVGAWSGSL
jgi:DNA replication protein DnaC